MADGNILSDFGINILEEEIDDVIFQTNEFLTDATFTGSQGPFWWILQMCMALAALFSLVMAAGMTYKMMVKCSGLLLFLSFYAGGILRQTQEWQTAGTAGVFWTSCPTYPTALARTHMTSMKRKPPKYQTSLRKCRN